MPVINPNVIYLMYLLNNIREAIFWLLIILGMVGFVVIFSSLDCKSEREYKSRLKNVKLFIVSFVILFLIYIVLPSQQVMIQMLVAKNITVERVEIAGETINRIYNDIIKVLHK